MTVDRKHVAAFLLLKTKIVHREVVVQWQTRTREGVDDEGGGKAHQPVAARQPGTLRLLVVGLEKYEHAGQQVAHERRRPRVAVQLVAGELLRYSN